MSLHEDEKLTSPTEEIEKVFVPEVDAEYIKAHGGTTKEVRNVSNLLLQIWQVDRSLTTCSGGTVFSSAKESHSALEQAVDAPIPRHLDRLVLELRKRVSGLHEREFMRLRLMILSQL